MNWYDLVFFHIFKRYYKNGRYKNDVPWLTASIILGVSSSFYILSGLLLSYYFFVSKEVPILNKYLILLLGFIFVILNFIWFTYNKRYKVIYEHCNTLADNSKKTEILSWIYIILGYISVPLVAIFIRT